MRAAATHPAPDSEPTAARLRAARRLLEERETSVAAAATIVVVAGLVVWQLVTVGMSVGQWDLLFVSGCSTVIGGLWLARGQSDRFAAMLERLANRGALERDDRAVSHAELATVQEAIDARGRRWADRAGVVFGVLIATAFVTVNATRSTHWPLLPTIVGPLAGAIGGFLVGRPLGRMTSYGLLGRFLDRADISFRTTPGHIDGAAGLKPLGDYYLYQALLLLLPAVFLVAWSLILLIPRWDRRYHGWRGPYLALLGVSICIELVAFVAPLWRTHTLMKRQKRAALVHADSDLGPAIVHAQRKLEENLDNDERAAARDRLAQLTSSYEEIETMPTWPLDQAVRRRLTLANAAVIVPLISQIAALAGWH